MSVQVKICGVTNVLDALVAAKAGANFVGMVLAPSRRQIDVATAVAVCSALPDFARPVLVFRDAALTEMAAALAATGCTAVQLHGQEPIESLARLSALAPKAELWKAWELDAPDAQFRLADYLSRAAQTGVRIARVLLDAPKDGQHPGYERMRAIAAGWCDREIELWCAGGLTPENLAKAVNGAPFAGVDVAGGVELSPGRKDADAVRRFIQAAAALGSLPG